MTFHDWITANAPRATKEAKQLAARAWAYAERNGRKAGVAAVKKREADVDTQKVEPTPKPAPPPRRRRKTSDED